MKPVICLFVLLAAVATNSGAGEVDTRSVVRLTPQQRAMVLAEMRHFLAGLQQVAEALARDDLETVAAVTRALGSPMARHMPADLGQALPEGFRALGASVHADFDQIALDAEALGDGSHTLSQLGATLGRCNACHDTYRIQQTDQP